jgi:hypothetical protein
MGSALCFPIEAMFFTTCVVVARLQHNELPITYRNIQKMMRDVFIYGDDIIVPAEEVEVIVDMLEKYGNVVSREKSFWKGRFRESCGMDAYDGVDITPIYIRNPLPNHKGETSSVISNVHTVNQLNNAGYTDTALFLMKEIEAVTGKLPSVGTDCSGLGWTFETGRNDKCRFNRGLHRMEVRTLVQRQIKKIDALEDYPALTKCLHKLTLREKGLVSSQNAVEQLKNLFTKRLADLPTQPKWESLRNEFQDAVMGDEDHLESSPRFGASTLKRQWVDPRNITRSMRA